MESSRDKPKGSEDRSELIQHILHAQSIHAALHLTEGADDSEMLRQYRRFVLLVHPDKCKLENSSEAFQKLSDFLKEYQRRRKRSRQDWAASSSEINDEDSNPSSDWGVWSTDDDVIPSEEAKAKDSNSHSSPNSATSTHQRAPSPPADVDRKPTYRIVQDAFMRETTSRTYEEEHGRLLDRSQGTSTFLEMSSSENTAQARAAREAHQSSHESKEVDTCVTNCAGTEAENSSSDAQSDSAQNASSESEQPPARHKPLATTTVIPDMQVANSVGSSTSTRQHEATPSNMSAKSIVDLVDFNEQDHAAPHVAPTHWLPNVVNIPTFLQLLSCSLCLSGTPHCSAQ